MSVSMHIASSSADISAASSSKSKEKTKSGRSFKQIQETDLSKALKEFERLKSIGTFQTEPIQYGKSSLDKSCFTNNLVGRFFVKLISIAVILGVFFEAIILSVDAFRDTKNCKVSVGAASARLFLCISYLGIGILIHRYQKLKEKDDDALIDYKDEHYKKFTFTVFLSHFDQLKKLAELTNEQMDVTLEILEKSNECLKKLNECSLDKMHFSPEMWVSLILYLMNKNNHNPQFNELIKNTLKTNQESSRKDEDEIIELTKPKPIKKRTKKFHGESTFNDPSIFDSKESLIRFDVANLFSEIKKVGYKNNLRALLIFDDNQEHCIGVDGLAYDDMSLALETVQDDSHTINLFN